MDFSPCADALQKIITDSQPTVPPVNPYAIPSVPVRNKLEDILARSKDNDLSHKQKCRKNKKAEKSKGYFEQQEFKKQKDSSMKKKDKKNKKKPHK